MRWHRRLKPTWQMEIQASHLAKYEQVSTLACIWLYFRVVSRIASETCEIKFDSRIGSCANFVPAQRIYCLHVRLYHEKGMVMV